MTCDIIDLRCIYVNDLIGSPILASLILMALFYSLASYNKWGYKTTIWMQIIVLPILFYFIAGTTLAFALATFFVSLAFAILQVRITGNR